ncbi:MAG: GDP-mannose 4,6-dehydratase [Desulfobacteraceae bacterium]|nr:GDP-mannose 4,6-dehydratase [Desulfobacteraceae bacterium]
MKGKNILITGISGFIGSYLAKHLVENGANVHGLVRWRTVYNPIKNLEERGVHNEVELINGDLIDISSLAHALDVSKPDIVFHLGAQSYVPRSFINPVETMETNVSGTQNLLEAVRIKGLDPKIVYAGSSEEYGLVIWSDRQYQQVKDKYKVLFPEPEKIPETPVNETNPLRPMSPYAVSKVACDYLIRNYYSSYGMKTIVSRGFNTEGAGRGSMFVTSEIIKQVMMLKLNERNKIEIGNVNVFRDWSHVLDIVKGYCIIAEKGKYGEVYNQGSSRTNSVLGYILLALENAGWRIEKIESVKGDKVVNNPTEKINSEIFGVEFERTKLDQLLLENELEYFLEDKGLIVHTNKGNIPIEFDSSRFRTAEVPLLLSDTSKIRRLGFEVRHTLEDIIRDQLNFYLKPENRQER